MADILENRRHFRLRRIIDVDWYVGDYKAEGQGVVLNISQSGALLYTDKVFRPQDKNEVLIAPASKEQLNFAPKKGKVVWLRRIDAPEPRFQCGIEFLSTEQEDRRFRDWLNEEVLKLGEASNINILNNYIV